MDINVINLNQLLTSDYFALFKIAPSFGLDESLVRAKYLDLQKVFHPDKFANANNEVKLLINQLSAHINNGYKSLLDPLLRGILLLHYHGIEFDLVTDTVLPNDFLFQQMEFHDNIDTAKAAKDIYKLESINRELGNLQNNLAKKLNDLFLQEDYLQAKQLVKQFAFYTRLKHKVTEAVETIY